MQLWCIKYVSGGNFVIRVIDAWLEQQLCHAGRLIVQETGVKKRFGSERPGEFRKPGDHRCTCQRAWFRLNAQTTRKDKVSNSIVLCSAGLPEWKYEEGDILETGAGSKRASLAHTGRVPVRRQRGSVLQTGTVEEYVKTSHKHVTTCHLDVVVQRTR